MGNSTVNQWISRGGAGSGDRTALVFRDASLGYSELDALSNRIARHLAKVGVRRGDNVGLCLDRSVEMVAVLLGILKAGAAYVPLDPAYPAARLGMMAEDARIRCSVAHARHAAKLGHIQSEILEWEAIEPELGGESESPVGIEVSPDDVAYVIFTSGSTGRPKGIEMPHRALANLIEWQLERKTFRPGAKVLQYSSISFDVSFQEIATTLASGGTLHLIADEERRDPRLLLGQLVEQGIGRLFLPYVAMRSLIETAHTIGTYPLELKEVITAGEQLRVDGAVRDFFSKIEGATLDNQYGPSETHVITAQLLEGDPSAWPDLPSIGTPLKNCEAFILDGEMKAVPDGEEGELYLAGRNLALGYIGRDDLTRAAFLDLPGFPRLYKTGDMAARNPDGSIAFLGRRDHQVKVLGHRVETGEINNAAADFPGIGQCLTHAFPGPGNIARLATYFTVGDGASVDVAQLRLHLAGKLPDYMVPAFLVELDAIPYTPSGKVDLKALPKPLIENSPYGGEQVSYASETEEGLAGIWEELLGLEGIPRSADFFELGGDSLSAVTLILRIGQRFGCDLPLATLLQAPTLEALARHIEQGADDGFSGYRSLKLVQRGAEGVIPLFLVHGGAGNILCFSKFAKNLGADQPVYAFQWSGWDGGRGEAGIEEMACAYRDELLKEFPSSPVRIGGYCIGGFIAMELARLLREAGIEVLEPLVVFDSPNLRSETYHPAGSGSSGDSLPWLKRTPPYALARRIRTRLSLRRIEREALGGKVVPFESRNWYCGQTQLAAVRKHRPLGTELPVLYFRSDCQGEEMMLPGWWSDPYMGFGELCRGPFDAHILGGTHDGILDHPEVAKLVNGAIGNGRE